MAFENLDTGVLDVFSSVTGSALNIPKGYWKPGFGAIYNGYLGTTSLLQYGQGTCNVGMSPDSKLAYTGAPGNVNLHHHSVTTYNGDHRVIGRSSVSGVQFRTSVVSNELYGAANIIAGKSVDIVGKNTVIAGASVTIGAPSIIIGKHDWYSASKSWDGKKNFDIPHPTKKDHRLRHVCVEGPTADVYVRGNLKDKNVIELPDYWKGLVDPETIDVSLTPFGSYQELYVESIQWGQRIVVKNSSGGPINCSYIVYGERNDGEKNIPEYQGLTPDDYPGDNSEYNINI